LGFLGQDLQTPEIASTLEISERTVKFYISNLLAKSGKKTRSSLLLWWVETGGAPATGEGADIQSLLRAPFARIEAELARIANLIGSRTAQMESEISAAASARDRAAEIDRTVKALKESIFGGGECLPKSTS
jgi:hypothetical protein